MTADRGSAPVEFVGIGVLVALCTLGILQVGVIAHVNAVVTDSAIAAAAYAALADSSLDAGIERARDLSEAGIAANLITTITARRTNSSGLPVAVVTIRYRVPGIGPWFPTLESSAIGRAFLEVP